MRRIIPVAVLALALVLTHTARAATAVSMVWDGTPMDVRLAVGQERRIEFPVPITLGIPSTLTPLLRVQTSGDTVYLLARQPFEMTRVVARARDGEDVYLLDLSANGDGRETAPIRVHVAAPIDTEVHPGGDPARLSDAGRVGYVALTRFAAQQLYAPARLMVDLPGVVRVPVASGPVALVRGDLVTATPLIAWRAEGLYLTAVKLTNRLSAPLVLDPRTLRGAWLAATFQHNRLAKQGDEADTTVVYLISSSPFAACL